MSIIKKYFGYYNYLPIYLILIFLINIILIQLPLLNVFGFEFSAINSILLAFLSGWYFIPILRNIKVLPKQAKIYRQYFYAASISFLLVPLLISLTHSFLTYTCSLKDGLLFYLVITCPSILIGYSFAIVSVSLSKRLNRILFILIFVSVLLIPLFEFYYNPQIYFYNPIFGYYPGTIYDEGLSVTSKLAGYRILNIIYFSAFSITLYKLILKDSGVKKKIVLSLQIIIAGLFIYYSPILGYSTTFNKLNSDLNGTVITKHFEIHYPAELNNRLVKAIAIYHEYYYSELKKFFGYDYPGRINSYLFRDDEQKKTLFGTANADVAKPWMNCAFITYSDYNSTLKHELAHCYSSQFGTGIFKVASGINPYLIEGIAVAADPVYDDNTINYMSSLAYNNGYKPELQNLFNNLSFFTQASSASYIYAGSFISYLIKTYGISKFEELYRNGSFSGTYKTSLTDVLNKYYSTLTNPELGKRKDEATYYFGRMSIFYKKCPRYVEDRIRKAWGEFNGKNYKAAEGLFSQILEVSNNYSAIIGYASCLQKQDSVGKAVSFINENINQFRNSAYFYSLELKLGDLYSEYGNFTEADTIYSRLIMQHPSRTYYYLANMRHDMISSDSLLNLYLRGNDFDKFNILKEFNSTKYDYNSIPVMIDLANTFNMNYKLFITNFKNRIDITDFSSSYAMYRLSNYMLVHLDFHNARKMAALALRFKGGDNYENLLQDNYDKANWFYLHQDMLKNMKMYMTN